MGIQLSDCLPDDILTLSKQALVFTCLQYKSFQNTVGKGEIVHFEQFHCFPQCFQKLSVLDASK